MLQNLTLHLRRGKKERRMCSVWSLAGMVHEHVSFHFGKADSYSGFKYIEGTLSSLEQCFLRARIQQPPCPPKKNRLLHQQPQAAAAVA